MTEMQQNVLQLYRQNPNIKSLDIMSAIGCSRSYAAYLLNWIYCGMEGPATAAKHDQQRQKREYNRCPAKRDYSLGNRVLMRDRTRRQCLGPGRPHYFLSEGKHHRICNNCADLYKKLTPINGEYGI